MAGIYIHVPFCERACHYCDFHFSTSLKLKDRLVLAIQNELNMRKGEIPEQINTIYFGGGTPSLLSEAELDEIIQCIFSNYQVSQQAEITLEANPEHITQSSLASWKKIGINRLSVGIQSFDEGTLNFLNRGHSGSQAKQAIQLANANGLENITIDLIYGIPGMEMNLWLEQIQQALQLGVPHISAYHLTIEDQTHFGYLAKKGKLHEIADTASAKQYDVLVELLKKAGFEQYEVSNFCQPGKESQHNSSYWKGTSYFGIGPSAHSYHNATRSWNVSSNLKYIALLEERKSPIEAAEKIDNTSAFNERLMIGLRTKWGVNLVELEQEFGSAPINRLKQTLNQEIAKSHFTFSNNQLQLTQEGLFLADNISMKLFV